VKRLMTICSSTLGKKFLMAITGLLLCGFLVVHLSGNLLLYVGVEQYNEYARALHDQAVLLAVAEAGLLLVFLLHLYLAFAISRENRAARQARYQVKELKHPNLLSPVRPENFMLLSGLVVFGFLVLHLVDFRFGLRRDIDYDLSEAETAMAVLATPLSGIVYTVGCVLLGAHLVHGFASAFQSLGVNHPKYEKVIHWVGVIFAVVIALGFVSFPIYYALFGS